MAQHVLINRRLCLLKYWDSFTGVPHAPAHALFHYDNAKPGRCFKNLPRCKKSNMHKKMRLRKKWGYRVIYYFLQPHYFSRLAGRFFLLDFLFPRRFSKQLVDLLRWKIFFNIAVSYSLIELTTLDIIVHQKHQQPTLGYFINNLTACFTVEVSVSIEQW